MFWGIVLTSLAIMLGIMLIGELVDFVIKQRKG